MKLRQVFLCNLMIGLLCLGCTKVVTERVTETVVEKKTGADDGGTIDSAGGGNGLNGRPLESYRINMQQNLVVTEVVMDLLETIHKKIPEFANRAYHILSHRGWYFVPVELSVIPSDRIGIYFASDQLALQSLREVWVDSRLFEKMTIQDQLVLIIHEMVIGVKLQSFGTGYDSCLARGGLEQLHEPESYSSRVKKCQQLYPAGYSEPINTFYLSSSDYSSVRDITEMVLNAKAINLLELKVLLESSGFGTYEYR